MSDIEEAYRTLGLDPGASITEVREAHRDLCLVWDASRFDDNPQVQKKTLDQLGRIEQAFETLRDFHGGTAKTEGETASSPPLGKSAVQPADQAENSRPGVPSLYEEIFRGRADKTPKRLLVGGIIAAVMVLVVFGIYLGGPVDQDEAEGSQSAPAIDEPLEMEGPPENLVSGPGELPSNPLQPDDSSESTVEMASEPGESTGISSVSPTDTPLKGEIESQPLPRTSLAVDAPPKEVSVVEPEQPESGNKPVLQRERLNLVEETEEPAGQEVEEDEASILALEILKEKSEIVRQLIEGGGVLDLSYQEWKTVRRNPPVFWIDIFTQRPTDRGELHLIWSVNIETGVVSPLSQAARDVEPDPLPR